MAWYQSSKSNPPDTGIGVVLAQSRYGRGSLRNRRVVSSLVRNARIKNIELVGSIRSKSCLVTRNWLLPPPHIVGRPSQVLSCATLVLAPRRSGGLTYFSLAASGDLCSPTVTTGGFTPDCRGEFLSMTAVGEDKIFEANPYVFIERSMLVLPLSGLVSCRIQRRNRQRFC